MEYGLVEHLDIDKIIEKHHDKLRVFHTERRNMGMTYIYILEKIKQEQSEGYSEDVKVEI